MSTQPRADPAPGRGHRRLVAALLAAAGLALLTAILVPLRDTLALASVVLLYLAAVVAVAVIGGLWPALAAAVASDILVNFFFVPPYHTLTVDDPDNLITLLVYVAVAVTVSVAVDVAARQRAAAARSGIEATLLARITADPIKETSLTSLLENIRDTLQMDSAALVETVDGRRTVVATAGRAPGSHPALTVPAGPALELVVGGPPVLAPDPRFLRRLATAVARALQAQRLAEQADKAQQLAEVDRLRAALLAAVGHDLRTPLAGIKAGVSSLRDPDLPLTPEQQQELLSTVEESADRMSELVENLLALSRLQAGALSVDARPIALDEVVAATLLHLPDPGTVTVAVGDDLPLALADPGLLERVLANLIINAQRVSPHGAAIEVRAEASAARIRLQVVDHGPGIPAEQRELVFAPFQRLDDASDTGLGLGLAIARGFTEAMSGTLTPTDTPGGGLTMTITLPRAPS
ncbi:DUF4118 domain-containing protein [Catellatospora sp. KI3]|uniref:sensor histidine kinase n=1 Tax=Catellatospora sp. KI3 TaxID=3041620 RepID=UPI002482CE19|nr:DUF4118 domain-containing protein [Catellatospora sp. KI3]MDI1462180.1 DUF4118 domain-containing protein [Catellatospora sp. KI3]